ncbi:hypothetical protein BKA69DRAFT_1100386 [Paraphysoderma sedebokerense]|nr:hypothetical protein BKA69DRAFT_1100386 [Paraphysoderma sedebokerense]
MPPLPPYPAHPSYPTYPSTVPLSKHAPSMMPVHMPVHPSSVLPHYPNSVSSSNSSSRSISPDYPSAPSAKTGKKVTHFPQVNKSGKSSKPEDPSKSSKKIVVSPLMSLLQAQETLISPPCIRQSLYPTLSDRDSLFEQTMFAIAKICEGKLYRAKALTLEDYFKSEWSVSRAQVYRFLSCARVLKDLQTFPQRPTKERICRILRQLTSTTTELKSLWAAILKKFDGDLTNLSTNDVTDLWGEVKLKLDRDGASSPNGVEDRPRNGHDGVTDGDDFHFTDGVSDGFDSTTENHDGSEYSRQRSNQSGLSDQRKRKNTLTSSQSSLEDVSAGNYSRLHDSNGTDGPMAKRAKTSPSRETSPRGPSQSSPNSEPSSHIHRQISSMPPTSSVSPHLSPVDTLRAIPLPSSRLASGDAEPNPQEYLRYTIEMIQYLSRMGFSLQPLVNGEWVGSCENWRFVKTGKSKRQQIEPSTSSHHSSIPASPRLDDNVVFDQNGDIETSKDSVDSNGSNTDSGCVTTGSESSNESVDKSKMNHRMDIDENVTPQLNDNIPDRVAVEVATE